jgi:hypothetical protein
VQVACICEKVLREHDNVPTLIRIVDIFNVETPIDPLPEGVHLGTPLTIFVALKSGDVAGEHEIGLRLTRPDGTTGPVRKWPVTFGGAERGVNLQLGFALDSPQLGLYWFDVLWSDEVLTRVPLRLKLRTAVDAVEPTEHVQTTPEVSS